MLPDILSAIARTLSFIGLFQAAGVAIFIAIFGRNLARSAAHIRRIGWAAALIAIVAVLAHYSLEAARMAGELAGITDASLQQILLQSPMGSMLELRIAGLLLIALSIQSQGRFSTTVALVGAVGSLLSFALVGHTSVHPNRPILALLLLAHLFAVAFWFGGLAPLYAVSAREPLRVAGEVIDAFSAIALWLAPGLAIVGVLIAMLLIPSFAVLREPYGRLLLAKALGFMLLMLLASANKWRFGPAIARGEAQAIPPFQRSVAMEIALIVLVLAVTAIMTGFFSPEH